MLSVASNPFMLSVVMLNFDQKDDKKMIFERHRIVKNVKINLTLDE